jgi:hypothetical protein
MLSCIIKMIRPDKPSQENHIWPKSINSSTWLNAKALSEQSNTIIVSLTPEMQQSFSLFKSTTRSCCPGNTNCYYILKAELPPLLMKHYGQWTKIDTCCRKLPRHVSQNCLISSCLPVKRLRRPERKFSNTTWTDRNFHERWVEVINLQNW